jgi:hypothetical protein
MTSKSPLVIDAGTIRELYSSESVFAALSATKLQTARTINGVSFDGSADITINAVDATARQAASVNLTSVAALPTDATGLVKMTNGVASLDARAYLTSITASNIASAVTPGTSGNVLTSNGTTWVSQASTGGGNTTPFGLWENSATISANYSITAGKNAMSAGPVSVANGILVTVPTGSVWTIV